MAQAGKHYITYSPMMPSPQNGDCLPCLQRCASGRWKVIALVAIIVIQSVVMYTGYMCGNRKPLSVTPLLSSRQRAAPSPQQDAATSPSKDHAAAVSQKDHAATAKTAAPTAAEVTKADEKSGSEKELKQRFPHFIIIGVKKAGTRALLNYLNMHPDIETASMEVHFFDRDDSYKEGLEYYRKQMPFSYSNQLTGEKSPSYFREPEVPERIHKFNESIKLILIVREPIERCMSNYLQHADGQEDFPSFEASVLLHNGEVNPRSAHIRNSDYNAYIDRWLELFPLDQINVVDGNLLIKSPHVVLKDLQKFLGVRQYIDESFFKYDEEKGFYCFYNRSESLKCLGDSKGRPHPPIKPDLKLKLYNYFKPKNRMFFDKINKTFDWELKVES